MAAPIPADDRAAQETPALPPFEAPGHGADAVGTLPRAAIEAQVAEHGYAIIRGAIDPIRIKEARVRIRQRFSPAHDTAPVGTPADAAQRNFQKLVLGGGSQTGHYVPRCVRVIYNPIWAEDLFGMRVVFEGLARLRNHLQGYPVDYAVTAPQDGFFTAARLQHYPAGGGFFAAHEDTIVETVTREAGLARFFQLVLLLTEKGTDFREGGAFVERDGARIDLEGLARAGDVLVYDGRSRHGVADIDPHITPDLRSLAGRLVAMASLYRDLRQSPADYDSYLSRDFRAA